MSGRFGFFDYAKPGKGVDENEPQKRRFIVFFALLFRKFFKLLQLNLLYLFACIPVIIVLLFPMTIISQTIVQNLKPTMMEQLEQAYTEDLKNLEKFREEQAAKAAEAQQNGQPEEQVFEPILLTPEDQIHQMEFWLTLLLITGFIMLWGAGPATAGFTYVLRNFAREEHAWVLSDFWEHLKKNFKQGILLFLVDLLAFILFYVAISFYSAQTNSLQFISYFIAVLAVVYTMMHYYIHQIMVTFRLSFKQLFKNSLLFAIAKLPRNIGISAVLFAIFYIVIVYTQIFSILIVALFLFSLCGFIINFCVQNVIKRYMMQ